MKERILKKLKRWLIIILVVLSIVGTYVIVRYNQDPQGLMNQLDGYYLKVTEMANKMYGLNIVPENISFPEKEKLTEAQKHYYFQQLNDPAKKIYVTIENNIEKINNCENDIPLPSSLNDVAKEKGIDYVAQEFQNAWDAFITDKCEYFYIDSSKMHLITKEISIGRKKQYEFYIGKGDNKTYFIDEFDSKEDVEFAKSELEKVAKEVLKSASGDNYNKIKYIHNWIVDNTEYETRKLANTSNAYGCIVNNSAICEGYARAFKYYMDKLNIPCILVSGDAVDEDGKSERHAWNYVYINNDWYAIDTTWDDPIIYGTGIIKEEIKYRYFLKGSVTMKKDHTTSGKVSEKGQEFEYPDLSRTDLF